MIRALCSSALFLILTTISASAEAGISYLGLCHPNFDCTGVLESFRGRPIVTGWIENTFGASCECGERILRQRKEKIIRVHLTNSPCLRNGRCGKHEVFAGLTVASADRKIRQKNPRILRKFRAVAERFKARLDNARGGLTCYVSPCLECDLSANARRVLFRITEDILPNCVLVDSVHNRECLLGKVCEKHGDNPGLSRPCIADLDGVDGKEVDLRKYRRATIDCDVRYYWEPWLNCIKLGKFVEPIERACQYPRRKFTQIKDRLCSLSSYRLCDTSSR